MNKNEIKQQLKDEGFPFVYEWEDAPNTVYQIHQHKDKVVLYILEGEVTFDFSSTKKVVKAGERIDVPPKTDHSAVVGPEGAKMIYAEMIEGDA